MKNRRHSPKSAAASKCVLLRSFESLPKKAIQPMRLEKHLNSRFYHAFIGLQPGSNGKQLARFKSAITHQHVRANEKEMKHQGV